MVRRLRGLLFLTAAVVLMTGIAPVASAAEKLSLTTPYPSVSVNPGSRVTFNLKVSTDTAGRVDLALAGVPATWTASLHGGGYVVSAVLTNGTDPTDVRLDIDLPADASGTTRITVSATGNGTHVDLPLDIKAEAQAGGEITLQPDFPGLKGAAGGSFSFNVSVKNGKDEDLTYTAAGQAPQGWTIDAKPTGAAQVVTGIAKAGGTAGVAVIVKAPADTAAGTYKIVVLVTVGDQQLEQDLAIEITGSYTLTLTTPEDLLSAHGPSGSATEQTFTLTNNGTAPITNVTLSATQPTNWKVDFDPVKIPSIEPAQTITVTAKVTPSGAAIAGDYSVTFRAGGDQANDSAEIRFTVETSLFGAIIGGLLIIGALGGLWWVFRRYGRR